MAITQGPHSSPSHRWASSTVQDLGFKWVVAVQPHGCHLAALQATDFGPFITMATSFCF